MLVESHHEVPEIACWIQRHTFRYVVRGSDFTLHSYLSSFGSIFDRVFSVRATLGQFATSQVRNNETGGIKHKFAYVSANKDELRSLPVLIRDVEARVGLGVRGSLKFRSLTPKRRRLTPNTITASVGRSF